MVVKDQDAQVRQWIAKNGERLDYREGKEIEGQTVYEFPERNLEDLLKNDPDPFVQACLRENPTVYDYDRFSEHWKQDFQVASPLERLALVRNPDVNYQLIKAVFDPEDTELGIDHTERKKLILASLTNPSVQEIGSSELWELASKWPRDSEIQPLVFRHAFANEDIRRETYKQTDIPEWRAEILTSCNDNDLETIQLGMQDSDDRCRELAHEKFKTRNFLASSFANILLSGVGRVSLKEKALGLHWMMSNTANYESVALKKALEDDDKAALRGLAKNRSLTLTTLKRVRDRLSELDDYAQYEAEQIIKEREEQIAPEDPNELFTTYVGMEGKFLEDKIDWIGKKLLEMEKWSLRRFFKWLFR